MAKKLLTKMPMPRGQAPRWRKKYQGKVYYFHGNYADAVKAWERKKVELDSSPLVNVAKNVAELEAMQERRRGTGHTFTPPSPITSIRFKPWEAVKRESEVSTVGQAIKEYHQQRQAMATMGTITEATVSSSQLNLSFFAKWIGNSAPLSKLNEKTLAEFFAYLAGEIKAKRMSKGYAHQNLLYCKAFIKRQWEQRRILLPRNLTSRDLVISTSNGNPKTLTDDELKNYWDKAGSLLRCCILLSLNCGFNQIDIATLKFGEVDWVLGTICKKRTKTARMPGVPSPTWKLWPSTLEALKANTSNKGEWVLLGQSGQPLITGGGLGRQDAIAKAWRYVVRKQGSMAQYKQLRKTAASLLASNPEFSRYAQYFLAHAPSSVADAHYIRPSQDQFDRAVSWLGEKFNFLR
jgi:hypothetical protein